MDEENKRFESENMEQQLQSMQDSNKVQQSQPIQNMDMMQQSQPTQGINVMQSPQPDYANGMFEQKDNSKPYYMKEDRKVFFGSLFFFVIVLLHIIISFSVHIENAKISIIVTQLLIVIPALVYMGCFKENPFSFMRFRKFHLGSAFLLIPFMLCLLPLMSICNAISMLFAKNTIQSAIDDITGGSVLVGVLLVAVLPAFVEETTFRGAIYQSLRGARPVRAIILSGFMFGAMHMNFNQFVYASVLGIVMAFVIEATGSIISTMIIHFCFNAQSVVIMTLLPKLYKNVFGMNEQQYNNMLNSSMNTSPAEMLKLIMLMIPVAIFATALAAVLYYVIARLNKRWYYICFLFSKKTKEQRITYPKPRLINGFTIAGFVVCFLMCVLSELVARGVINL